MAKDRLYEERCKVRLIFEARFEPIRESFDRRGKVLDAVYTSFMKDLEHWRVENVKIQVLDDLQAPSKIIEVGHNSYRIHFEDFDNINKFSKNIKEFITIFHKQYNDIKISYKRLGFRMISIYNHESFSSFAHINTKVSESFLKDLKPFSLSTTDIMLQFTHQTGFVAFGPTKLGEDWVKANFSFPDLNVPEYGLGTDLDTYVLEPNLNKDSEVYSTYGELLNLSLSLQEEIFKKVTSSER